MDVLNLDRVRSSDDGTFGYLTRGEQEIAVTCELPWRNNAGDTSCIPKGTYEVVRYRSPSKGDVFLLKNVPNRTMIEIHAGNTIHDVLGCIAVGNTFGEIQGKPAVLGSVGTLKNMLKFLPMSFMLEITGVVG